MLRLKRVLYIEMHLSLWKNHKNLQVLYRVSTEEYAKNRRNREELLQDKYRRKAGKRIVLFAHIGLTRGIIKSGRKEHENVKLLS